MNKLSGELVDQLQGREGQTRGAIALDSGQAVDRLRIAVPLKPFEAKGRAGAIGQPPRKAPSILAGNSRFARRRISSPIITPPLLSASTPVCMAK